MEQNHVHDFRDSEVKFYEFHYFIDSVVELLNFHDFHNSGVEFYEFIYFIDYCMECMHIFFFVVFVVKLFSGIFKF